MMATVDQGSGVGSGVATSIVCDCKPYAERRAEDATQLIKALKKMRASFETQKVHEVLLQQPKRVGS